MTRIHFSIACMLACGAPAVAASQQPPVVPLRSVVDPSAKTTETVGAVRGLSHLPDGRVLVNDATRRRLLLFDASMTTYTVVVDSTPGRLNSYGRGAAPFVGYVGDSSIFVDQTSQSLLVLDGKGRIARVAAPPKPADMYYLGQGSGIDPQGRLVYRSYIRAPIPTSAPAPGAVQPPSIQPDSAPIVRADWETGQVDTIAKFKIASGTRSQMLMSSDGSRTYKITVNALSWMDDWTMNSEGMIAIVRGQDYHVDWISSDGKHTASPKMPYDWRRLTDEDKTAIVDSARVMNDSLVKMQGGGMRSMSVSATGQTTTTIIPTKYEYAPLSEMPDYYPPIRANALQADRDGNIWILPYTSAQGKGKGIVYDVVNNKGELFERVQLPENRSIVGFGKGGIIYMMVPAPLAKPTDRPGSAGFYIERTMVAPGGSSKQ